MQSSQFCFPQCAAVAGSGRLGNGAAGRSNTNRVNAKTRRINRGIGSKPQVVPQGDTTVTTSANAAPARRPRCRGNAMTARLSVTSSTNSSCARATNEGVSRRANKPLMEKRRRARINQSLAVLKSLILESARLENTKHSKLEKADILELTVRHLQRQRAVGPGGLTKYRAGFAECTREVSRFLEVEAVTTSPDEASSLKTRLLRHLQSCAADLDAEVSQETQSNKSEPDIKEEATVVSERSQPENSADGDENNNADNKFQAASSENNNASESQMLSVVQVLPSRLPDGQVIFLLPSNYVQLAAWARATSGNSVSALPALPSATTPPPNRPSVIVQELVQEDEEMEEPLDCSRRHSQIPPLIPIMPEEQHDDIVPEDGSPVWRPWDTHS